jgi:hypothetical protein
MDIATIATTLGSAIGSFFLIKSAFDKRFDKIDIDFQEVRKDLKEIRTELGHTNERISRIEGYIEGRDISQKRKTGT